MICPELIFATFSLQYRPAESDGSLCYRGTGIYYCIVYRTKVNKSYVISNLNFYLENVVEFGIRSDYDSGSESHRKVGYGISVAEPVHF